MERPLTYLALGQLAALFLGMLFAAAGVKFWTRGHPDWEMAQFPMVVQRADWFAHYGLWFLIPIGTWLVCSLLVSQGRLTLAFADGWLYFMGIGLMALILLMGIVASLGCIIAMVS